MSPCGLYQPGSETGSEKVPSVSETIDWARVLVLLHAYDLKPDVVSETLSVFLKFEEDIEIVRERVFEIAKNAVKGP